MKVLLRAIDAILALVLYPLVILAGRSRDKQGSPPAQPSPVEYDWTVAAGASTPGTGFMITISGTATNTRYARGLEITQVHLRDHQTNERIRAEIAVTPVSPGLPLTNSFVLRTPEQTNQRRDLRLGFAPVYLVRHRLWPDSVSVLGAPVELRFDATTPRP